MTRRSVFFGGQAAGVCAGVVLVGQFACSDTADDRGTSSDPVPSAQPAGTTRGWLPSGEDRARAEREAQLAAIDIAPCEFGDSTLERAVREEMLEQPYRRPVPTTPGQVERLRLSGSVTSLDGIGCLRGLAELTIDGLGVGSDPGARAEPIDGAPLKQLEALESLRIAWRLLSDASVLGETNATVLELRLPPGGAAQAMVDGVAGAVRLRTLDITSWDSLNLDAVGDLPNLETLRVIAMGENRFDARAVANVTTLRRVLLDGVTAWDDWSALTALEAVQISGDVPSLDGLENAAGLQTFRCSGCADVSSLAGHPWLTTVELKDPGLTDLSPLGGLPRLSSVHVEGDVSTLGDLGSCPELEVLTIGGGELVDLQPLRGAPLLRLTVVACQLQKLDGIEGMATLYDLNVFNNAVDDLTPLTGLPLASLNVANNDVRDVSPLRELPLTTLYLSGNPLSTLAPLGSLTDLSWLHLDDCDLTSLEGLETLPLVHLSASNNQLTNLAGISGAKLTFLNLAGNQLTTLSILDDLPWTPLNTSYQFAGNPLSAATVDELQRRCESRPCTELTWTDGTGSDVRCGGGCTVP